ncbi:MAG: hypothetical protein IJT12_04630 [Paludibacteraceae bacterium]|nr:hypothetical protein [Paludibacteraceae bacterium]
MDIHTEFLLEEYDSLRPVLERMSTVVEELLSKTLRQNGIEVTTVKTRVKTRDSLAGKLALKGSKYATIDDITDLLGARIITFYTDDVDRIAAMAERLFDIDWENSVDKRRLHQLDSFGYNSLHYICRLPESLYKDPAFPQLNTIRFELQLRTTLQHAWAAINHDTGYKSGVEIPREYMRQMSRLASLLELADDEFSRIRTELTAYRRRVQQLVSSGRLDDVQLDGDTFGNYLQTEPFDALNKRIAALNQAEIQQVPLDSYLRVFKAFDCRTLGDVNRLFLKYEEDAYALARYQLGNTDIDIISSAVGVQNICIVYILRQGGGKIGLTRLFNALNGDNPQNEQLAEITFTQASNLPFMK